jgi:hypothetical protein
LHNALAGRDDLARPVRQRDHRKFGVAIGALDDALITVIQRGGAHAHQNLPGRRLWISAGGIEHQPVETGGFPHLIGFHAVSVWLSSMPATLLRALRRLPNMAMPSAATLALTA